ncbi:protein SNORC-like [Myxocyprinus asiaticus]|uniref:protein SNORC-like n=1 Tax=Myxocyprinus asiaticus TaxID=70543 RepID=UPI00222159F7|nr:protein SNORC-like [Myxocyprinus asiaticus]
MGDCSSYSGSSRLVLCAVLAICMAFVQTVADSSPTLQNDNQDTLSGAGAIDVTTKHPFHDLTEKSFTFDNEDGTPSLTLDEEEGVLGPGAITAIVIAVFLGASVLLALIVITLRKFTAS